MLTQAGTFWWWEKSQQGWIWNTFAGSQREQHSWWVPAGGSCGEFVGSDLHACNLFPPHRSVSEQLRLKRCDFERQQLDESKWAWQAAAQKPSGCHHQGRTNTWLCGRAMAQCLPALLPAQMWKLLYFALTEALEILPWHVSAERCPWPAHRRVEGSLQGSTLDGEEVEEQQKDGKRSTASKVSIYGSACCGVLCSCLCKCWRLLL